MKNRCPKCGHEWEAPAKNQAKGGKARWRGTKKKDRSEAARKAARARWADSQNTTVSNTGANTKT